MHVSTNQGEVVEGMKYSVVIEVGLPYKFDARTTKTAPESLRPFGGQIQPCPLIGQPTSTYPHITR